MREILIKAQDWNQSCEPPMSIVEAATTTLSICQGHVKRFPEDIHAGVNEWKTSEWQTQISADLKEIQDQEYPEEVEEKPTQETAWSCAIWRERMARRGAERFG